MVRILLFLLITGLHSNAASEKVKDGEVRFQKTISLTIKFSELSVNNGKVMILVKNEQKLDFAKLVIPINNNSSSVTLEVEPGKYAVVAFHDINSNEKLDKNMFGIPTEPYGFSNNARGLLGEPDFEEQLVEVLSPKTITFILE
ncbi:MAG: DUF2141 domain-containing protein [Flavobacteriales bacterium]|nr:DUF2141 domain-containing protein [Flavobacteriales bacterium]